MHAVKQHTSVAVTCPSVKCRPVPQDTRHKSFSAVISAQGHVVTSTIAKWKVSQQIQLWGPQLRKHYCSDILCCVPQPTCVRYLLIKTVFKIMIVPGNFRQHMAFQVGNLMGLAVELGVKYITSGCPTFITQKQLNLIYQTVSFVCSMTRCPIFVLAKHWPAAALSFISTTISQLIVLIDLRMPLILDSFMAPSVHSDPLVRP